jgi:hypothetical protein
MHDGVNDMASCKMAVLLVLTATNMPYFQFRAGYGRMSLQESVLQQSMEAVPQSLHHKCDSNATCICM